jgi:hypothetical protein
MEDTQAVTEKSHVQLLAIILFCDKAIYIIQIHLERKRYTGTCESYLNSRYSFHNSRLSVSHMANRT